MASMQVAETQFPELAWLSEVREVCVPLSEAKPIWVRYGNVTSGPSIPHPERHPYCEINLILSGRGVHYASRLACQRRAGDIFLAGPGLPHYSRITQYPLEVVTVYFLPSLLLELGSSGDGGQLMSRVAAVGSPEDVFFRPTPKLRRILETAFRAMWSEFNEPMFGSQLKLRARLLDILVDVVRSEQASGAAPRKRLPEGNWQQVERALNYLREHYALEVYSRDVAAAAGVSESNLRKLFRECIGMPWVQYLQGYRIHRAATLLADPNCTVLEAAAAVGFDDLSHFNSAFRSFMGVSPGYFAKHPAETPRRKKPS